MAAYPKVSKVKQGGYRAPNTKPADLGNRGQTGKTTNVKPKATTINNASPNTRAVGQVSRTGPDGKMTEAEKKANKARTRREAKKRLKASKPSGVTKASRSIQHLRQAAKGASAGSAAAIALRVAEKWEEAEKAATRRAAGIPDA